MKRILVLALAPLLFARLLSGCEAGGEVGAPEAPPTPGLTLANPMREVESASALSEAGVVIDAPEGASDVEYHIIGGTVAQVAFMLDGHAYTYRAAEGEEDISGVYTAFSDEALTVSWEFESECVSATVKTAEGGGRLATWHEAGITYSLWAEDDVADDAISDLILKLVTQQGLADDAAEEAFAPIDFLDAGIARADLDGDGAMEDIAVAAEEDEYGSLWYVLSVTAADGTVYALDPGAHAGMSGIEYLSALCIVDLDPADGLLEVVISGDYASSDYITLICRFDGTALSTASHMDDAGRLQAGIYGEFLSEGEAGTVIIGNTVHMLGTWWGSRPYMLSPGGGFTFIPVPGSLWERDIDPDDPENWVWEYPAALEVTAPVPAVLDTGSAEALPPGTKLLVTASDGLTDVHFVADTGLAGVISYDTPVTEENGWDRRINGADESAYFAAIPYAG